MTNLVGITLVICLVIGLPVLIQNTEKEIQAEMKVEYTQCLKEKGATEFGCKSRVETKRRRDLE